MRSFIIPALVAVISGCLGGANVGARSAELGSLAQVPLTHLYRTDMGGIRDSARLVVGDSAAWQRVWRQARANIARPGPAPTVDFSRAIVVVAALGERPVTGFWISVDSSFATTSHRVVHVTRYTIDDRCHRGQALTHPLDIVTLPKDALPIVFEERAVFLPDCGAGRPSPPPLVP